jgi:integrase
MRTARPRIASGWCAAPPHQATSYNAARDAAGLPPLPFHHLRHTLATLAIRGLDPATVPVLLGHSKITTTERYLHARPLNELAERMDAIFRVSPEVGRELLDAPVAPE